MMSFDIDIVYLWVDSSDSAWAEKFYNAKKENVPKESVSKCRFQNDNELKYSVRSIIKYADWIRNIYIVTDNQIPKWLNTQNKRIKIIDHKDIMPSDSLPCFNSCAIETCLHKIPGLSEFFLYANDDMFFWNNVKPDFFFTEEGSPIYRFNKRILNKKYKHIYGHTINRAYHLVKNRYSDCIKFFPHHGIDPYRKSYLEECINVFKNEFDRTTYNQFRSFEDIQRAIFAYYAVTVKNAKAVLPKSIWSFLGYTKKSGLIECNKKYLLHINTIKSPLLCINNNKKTTEEDIKLMVKILENKFHEKSEFEK